MKVNAKSIPDFFEKCDKFKDIIIYIDKLITSIDPDIDRKLYDLPTMCGMGYAPLPYKANDCLGGVWPIIGLMPQKNYAALYIMAANDNKTIVEEYKDKLGKVSTGKSCIRIKNLNDINKEELKNIIKDTLEWYYSKLKK